MTGNGSCASTSNAARVGWRPTPTSAPSIGRWCGPWPGSDGPPAWPSKPTGLAMSWKRSVRCRRRPGAGGPGAKPAAQIEDYRRTYHITDRDRALGPEPRDPAQRAARQRARTAIEQVQAKQRPPDRSRDLQPTAERTNQPRPQQRRSRPGPERAAG